MTPNATQTFTLTVNQAPTITSANSATFTVGSVGTFTMMATGAPVPTFSESGALPSGVTLTSAGILSGTPAAGTGGNYPITITAQNGVTPNASQTFTLTVNQVPAITSASSATFKVGSSGTFTVTTTGFPKPTLSESGSLPNGVTFTPSTGVVKGTPATSTGGSYPITVTAQNGVTPNAVQTFTLTVDQAPKITSASSTTFTVGKAGTFTLIATGFPAPTFSESGALPSGVTLLPTGVLSGTPAAGTAGSYRVTITAQNAVTPNATQTFTLTVNQAPSITSPNTTTFTVGSAGTFTVTAAGSPKPTLTESGKLPSGVTFTASSGVLKGTPAAGTAGSYPITLTAQNGVTPNAVQTFLLTVNPQPGVPVVTSATTANGTVGAAFSYQITATNSPTTYSASGLPAGLTLNTGTGLISGMPTAVGVSNVTVHATNSIGTGTANLALTITLAPYVTINQAATQPDPTNNSPINFTVVFSAPVTGFTNAGVVLGGTAGATTAVVSGSGTTYNVAVSGMTQTGTVTATVAAGAASANGSLNTASTSTDNVVTYDITVPTVTINQAAGQANPATTSPINFTVVFSKTVTGLTSAGVVLGGTAGATTAVVSGSGTTYNVAVSGMTQTGTVIASIGAGVAHDLAGNTNTASTSTNNTITFNFPAPTVTINQAATQADPTNGSTINFTVVFSAPVTGFTNTGVVLGGTAGATTAVVSGSGTTYNVAVSGMVQTGTVTATIAAGAASANGSLNTASTSTDNAVTYDITAPTVTINQAAVQANPATTSPINFTVVFSKTVTGLTSAGVVLGGTAGATTAVVSGSGTTYNVAVSGMVQTGTATASVAAGAAVDLAGNSSTASTSTDNTVTFALSTTPFGHVFVLVEENANYSDVIGSALMPYLNGLANQYGLATQYYANTHPSIGNYMMLTTGQILTNDDTQTPLTFPVSVDNVVRELLAAGKTWKTYAESIPSIGYVGGDSGEFATRHVPLPYMTDVQDSPTQLPNIVPFTQFATDLANGTLPNYSFITPNLCDDAHDCGLDVADNWLKTNIDPLIKSSLFRQDGVLIITFDESGSDNTNGGGQVPAVIVSPFTIPGYQSTTLYQEPSVLRLTLEGLGVHALPGAAATAPPMWEFFNFGSTLPTSPKVTVNQAATQVDPTNGSPINFTVVFSEAVTGFTNAGVVLGGTAGATTAVVSGSGTTYNVAVSGMAQTGTVTASIAAGAATGVSSDIVNASSTSTDNVVTYDITAPTVTINQAAGQANPATTSPINFTVVFSKTVTGLTSAGVVLGGTAGATTAVVSGSGTTYNVAVSGMTQTGTVIASIGAGVAHDLAGNTNTASTSTNNTITFNFPAPTVTINQAATQADPTNGSTINFTVVFSAPVTGFTNTGVVLGGTAGATTAVVSGSGTTYNVAVSGMVQTGTVTATIAAGAASANGSLNTASTSTDNAVTYDITAPTVTINQAAVQANPATTSPINFTVVFSKTVTGLTSAGVVLGGTAGATTAVVSGSGTTYNVAVSGMTQTGTVIASIGAGVAHDLAGNTNTASTSTNNTITFNFPAPTVTINQAATQADPTNGSTINFTVVFSAPVTGFTNTGVVLGGTAGATTAVVSGSGPAQAVNGYINLDLTNPVTPGTHLTSTILANGTVGSLSGWASSGTAANMSVGAHQPLCALQNNITVGGVSYGPGTVSQSFAMVMNSGDTFWQADYTGGNNKIAISFCLTLPTSSSDVMDIVSIQDASGFTTWLQIGSGANSLDLEVTPNPTTASIAVTPGGTYWVSMLDDEAAGKASFAVFQPNYPYGQVGTTQSHSQVTSSAITAIRIGNAEVGTSSSTMYMENLIFDSTNATFPLVPATGSNGSGATYNVAVSGMTQTGTVTASVAAGAASANGSLNTASTSTDNTVTFNFPSPTVTINQATTQADPTAVSPINFTVVFSRAVSGFTNTGVILGGTGGATTAVVSGSGTTYNVAVSGMTQSGTVTASVAAGAAIANGSSNTASTSTDNTVTYNFPIPTVTINQAATQPDPTNSSPINFTAVFNVPVTGFTNTGVVLGGTAGATTAVVSGSGTTYNVAVSGMTQTGTVTATVAAGAASANGSSNTASTSTDNTVTYDITAPTVTINQAAGQANPATTSPINFTVVFSKTVTGLTSAGVVLGGTAGATTAVVSGSGTTYNVAVSGMTQTGTVTASVAAGAVHDLAGNTNAASTSTNNTVTFNFPAPTVTINQAASQADPTNSLPINFTAVFNVPVTGLTNTGVVLGGTAGATTAVVSGSGTTYNVAVSGMTQTGTVTATVAAGAASANGSSNTASTSTDNTVTYDITAPTVTINQAAGQANPATTSPINFTVVFSKTVTGLTSAGVVLGGTAGATTAVVTGSGTTYNVAVSGMVQNGTVTASVAAGAAVDLAGNPSTASTSTNNTVTFNFPAPTVTINQAASQADPTNGSTINFTVVFSAPVTGFTNTGVVLGGTAGATTAVVTGSGTTYNVAVSGITQTGTVTATVAAGAASANGSLNTASTSTDNVVTYDITAPTVTINQAATQADPTSGSPINFTVVFSKTVTGFTNAGVVLGGTAGATTVVVSGSGATYNVAVSGMTQSGTVIAAVAAGAAIDLAGNSSTTSTNTDNMVTYVLSAIPTLVQHVSTQSNGGHEKEGPAFYINLPQPTLAGNCLVLGLTHHYSALRTVAITDNKSNTWPSPAASIDNTTSGISTKIYAIAPATGTQAIKVTFDAALFDVHFSVSEFYNCATSGITVLTDGSAASTNAKGGPTLSSGSFTTTTSGDLIWNYAVDTHDGDLGNGTPVTQWTKGTSFTKLSADRNFNTYAQYQVQSLAGAINPAFTVAGAANDEFNDVAIAIKAAPAGTAPSGIHIVHEFHFQLQSGSTTVLDVPSTGNLIVPAFSIYSSSGGNNIKSITDGINTYTKEQPSTEAGQIFHADNATTSTDLTMTVASGTPADSTEVIVYDVSGAAAVPFDKSAVVPYVAQPATDANLNNAPAITPSTANGLVIAVLQMGVGPPSGMALPGYTYTTMWSTGMTDASTFNFGEGHAIVFNTTTAQLTFNWTIANGNKASGCSALAVAFKAASP